MNNKHYGLAIVASLNRALAIRGPGDRRSRSSIFPSMDRLWTDPGAIVRSNAHVESVTRPTVRRVYAGRNPVTRSARSARRSPNRRVESVHQSVQRPQCRSGRGKSVALSERQSLAFRHSRALSLHPRSATAPSRPTASVRDPFVRDRFSAGPSDATRERR